MNPDVTGIAKTARHLIGVSGGRDSVALLHWLHAHGFRKFIVCHVDHRLRGRASTQDAVFVKRLAAQLGYEFEGGDIDILTEAARARQSVETFARAARLNFFAAMSRKHRCSRVILAHHADDQAETVLMRVLRGTGIGGLAAMRSPASIQVAARSLTLLRPLLAVRRSEINAYIAEHRLKYREDVSNSDATPTRNRLRLSLLPTINNALRTDAVPAMIRLATIAAREDDCLNTMMMNLAKQTLTNDGKLSLTNEFRAAHPALQHRVLHHWLREQKVSDIDNGLIERALRLMTERVPAKLNLTGGHWLRRKAGALWVQRANEADGAGCKRSCAPR